MQNRHYKKNACNLVLLNLKKTFFSLSRFWPGFQTRSVKKTRQTLANLEQDLSLRFAAQGRGHSGQNKCKEAKHFKKYPYSCTVFKIRLKRQTFSIFPFFFN